VSLCPILGVAVCCVMLIVPECRSLGLLVARITYGYACIKNPSLGNQYPLQDLLMPCHSQFVPEPQVQERGKVENETDIEIETAQRVRQEAQY
jgi:hypothetical protein